MMKCMILLTKPAWDIKIFLGSAVGMEGPWDHKQISQNLYDDKVKEGDKDSFHIMGIISVSTETPHALLIQAQIFTPIVISDTKLFPTSGASDWFIRNIWVFNRTLWAQKKMRWALVIALSLCKISGYEYSSRKQASHFFPLSLATMSRRQKGVVLHSHPLLYSQKIVTAHSLASVTAIDRENPWGQALE